MKKYGRLLALLLTGTLMLTGCSINVNNLIDNVNDDADEDDTDEDDVDDTDKDSEDSNDSDDSDDFDEIDVNNPDGLGGDGKGPDEDALSGIKQYDIYNNGNYFVQIQDRVYFRVYGPSAHSTEVLWGAFMDYPTGGESEICYYDENTGEVMDAFTDYGYGKMVFCDSVFYMNGLDGNGNSYVYSVDSVGNIVNEYVSSGEIIDFSEDCAVTIIRSENGSSVGFTGISEKGKKSFSFDAASEGYVNYLGCFQEYFIYSVNDYSSNLLRFYSYNMSNSNGNPIYLGDISLDKGIETFDYAEYVQSDWVMFSFGGPAYIGVSCHSGTGHVFGGGFILCAEPWAADSIRIEEPIYTSDFYNMPYLEFTESGYTLRDNEPFTYGLAYYDEGYAGLIYHDYGGRDLIIDEHMFDDYSYDSAYSTLILAEGPKPSDDVYVMRVTQIREESASIGWRDGFRCIRMEYLRFNYANGETEVIATIEY